VSPPQYGNAFNEAKERGERSASFLRARNPTLFQQHCDKVNRQRQRRRREINDARNARNARQQALKQALKQLVVEKFGAFKALFRTSSIEPEDQVKGGQMKTGLIAAWGGIVPKEAEKADDGSDDPHVTTFAQVSWD